MLTADHLSKSYGTRVAVSDMSLNVARGEVLGLLGPNGAGKSTTVAMLCGLTRPDAGEVRVDGQLLQGDASPVKRRIGLVPQDLALYEDLSTAENLRLFGALYGLNAPLLKTRADEALSLVGLLDRRKEKPGSFSGGMKRRLNIACALMHDPDILILDEPTVGIDPQSRNAIFDNLETLKANGKAIIYTTHYMEEAERMCDRVMIMDHGQIVANDTLHGLFSRLPTKGAVEFEIDGKPDLQQLAGLSGIRSAEQVETRLRASVEDFARDVPAMIAWLAGQGFAISRITASRVTLEDVFLELTGRALRD